MGYWIKLYTEVLDDFKYHQLPVSSQVLMYELFLLAGKEANDGKLPDSIEGIAFGLHRTEKFIQQHIQPLLDCEIVTNGNGYTVTKFAERQAPVTAAERNREHRRNVTVTQPLRGRYEPVTNRNVDTEGDTDTESDTDTEGEGEENRANAQKTTTSTAYNSLSQNQKLYFDTSGEYATAKQIPEIDIAINRLRNTKWFSEHPGQLPEYLAAIFGIWIDTRGKDGKPYQRNNPGWLDWAISQEYRVKWMDEMAKEEAQV